MAHTDGPSAGAEPAIERLLDLAVYAPVGVFVTLRDDLPKHIRQGRQALENRVQLARFIGQLAVQQGRKEIAKRLDEAARQRASATTSAPVEVDAVEVDGTAPAEPDEAPAVPLIQTATPEVPEPSVTPLDATALPIAEYQSLAAIHVVQRLATLGPDELEQIRRFEVAHRGRRTILAKIAQLQDGA